MKPFLLASAALLLAPLANAVDVNVSYSEAFSEKLAEDYGEREGEKLTERLTSQLERKFEDVAGVQTINVVIEDAKPNRPTMKQMSDQIGLSYQSFSLGGADLHGEVISMDGSTLAEIDYDWYENDIRWSEGRSTWGDAMRTFQRFSGKLSKAAKEGSSDLLN
ncbi:MAG: hypothetical protein CMK09_17860 [Ponticaulis sp.]|nr:hypothetical protein [Ponticaulis sp.]|tara:strand:+ start:778 stop:1266 length:489 start_codon:yes stop_codon:yes gene_type:complete